MFTDSFTLNTGATIPKLGLGTWFIKDRDAVGAVAAALDLGYRHIDTAQAYGNEAGVGAAVRASDVPREDIFVTSKVSAGAKSYDKAAASIDASLATTGLDYLDLMLIHAPTPWGKLHGNNRFFEENREVWRALEDAQRAGKVRAIGVSNFEREDLDNILAVATIKPAVNQVLAHIGNTPFELIEYTQGKGILVEAYSPVAHGVLLGNETVKAVATKYGVSAVQLAIRYCLELGTLPLPKTANPEHMRTNAAVDFAITPADMKALKEIAPVTDYGLANVMPVFGGTWTPAGIVKSLFRRRRRD